MSRLRNPLFATVAVALLTFAWVLVWLLAFHWPHQNELRAAQGRFAAQIEPVDADLQRIRSKTKTLQEDKLDALIASDLTPTRRLRTELQAKLLKPNARYELIHLAHAEKDQWHALFRPRNAQGDSLATLVDLIELRLEEEIGVHRVELKGPANPDVDTTAVAGDLWLTITLGPGRSRPREQAP